MDKAALLTEFRARVDELDKYQSFIDKATSQKGKFAAAVVEKVIKDNTEKIVHVAEAIMPLTTDVEAVIETMNGERQATLDGRQTSQFALEELELRLAIGELDDAGFDAESKSLRDSIGSIDSRVAAIDVDLDQFKEQLARWLTLGERAGLLAKPTKKKKDAAKSEADSEVIIEVEPVEQNTAAERRPTLPEPADEELEAFDDEDTGARRSEKPGTSEDLSAVLGEDEEIEAAPAKPQRPAEVERNEIDILGDENELEAAPDDAAAPAGGEENRRAVLLYQEGTAEEQIYPFNGDQMTLGRGRDNDIQVKNDSKVSRYHCKLYRRGPNFYVEDNKSANGSLVNGELITERRLFGGEEIIIGETFFRFRIMD